MPVRTASAEWKGTLAKGSGVMKMESGAYEGAFSVPSRFENGNGTNPEELIAAAHAGCFSMALTAGLTRGGFQVDTVNTSAAVHIDKGDDGWSITKIHLTCEAKVGEIDDAAFQEQASAAKAGCPVSKALSGGPTITLEAKLVS